MSKQKGKIAGVVGMALGALIALTPFQLAPVCDGLLELANGRMVHMRCHYTGQAEVYLGVIALIIGIMIFANKEATVRKSLGLVMAVVGIAVILLPTNAGIGVCMNPMECHTTAKVLYILGGLLIADGLFLQTEKREAKVSSSNQGISG